MRIRVMMRLSVMFVCFTAIACMLHCPVALAQSVAPGTGNPARTKEAKDTLNHAKTKSRTAKLNLKAAVDPAAKKAAADAAEEAVKAIVDQNRKCDKGQFTEVRWWLPVNYSGAGDSEHDLDPDPDNNKSKTNGVTCFFGAEGPSSYINQVQFLYGFGSSSSSVSADIAALQFRYGFQISLGSTITGAAPNSSGSQPAPPNGKATSAQAIQQIENGGDFYMRGTWPLAYAVQRTHTNAKPALTGLIAFVPRLGFTVPGVSAQQTLTESTEYNWNIPLEAYGQINALGDSGFIYADARSGAQWVQPEFAAAAGLGSKNIFLLTQLAAGIQFNGLIRVGFQKFYGPAQAFNVKQSEFNKWHLVIQFAPKQIKNQ